MFQTRYWTALLFSIYLFVPINCQANTDMTVNSIKRGIVINDNYDDGAVFIDKMLQAANSLNNYCADFEMNVYKNKQTIEETGTFWFRKPKLLRIEVRSGPRKGSMAILAKDGKIHGHLGGILKYFNSAVSTNSELARAINDFPMADSDFYSLVDYLENMLKQGDKSRITKAPMQTIKVNELVYIVDLYKPDKDLKTLLLKRIYVSAKSYLPVFWEDYTQGKLFSESSWQNMHINLNLPDKLFEP